MYGAGAVGSMESWSHMGRTAGALGPLPGPPPLCWADGIRKQDTPSTHALHRIGFISSSSLPSCLPLLPPQPLQTRYEPETPCQTD